MKKLYTILAVLMTFFCVSAQTTEERNRLVVTEKSGEQTAFKVENIESISFEYVNEGTDGFGVDITCSSIGITGATITFTPIIPFGAIFLAFSISSPIAFKFAFMGLLLNSSS